MTLYEEAQKWSVKTFGKPLRPGVAELIHEASVEHENGRMTIDDVIDWLRMISAERARGVYIVLRPAAWMEGRRT